MKKLAVIAALAISVMGFNSAEANAIDSEVVEMSHWTKFRDKFIDKVKNSGRDREDSYDRSQAGYARDGYGYDDRYGYNDRYDDRYDNRRRQPPPPPPPPPRYGGHRQPPPPPGHRPPPPPPRR